MNIHVFPYIAIFCYVLSSVSYLKNFRSYFVIIPESDPFFTKSVDFKHVSMATKDGGNTRFALFYQYWLRFTKCQTCNMSDSRSLK